VLAVLALIALVSRTIGELTHILLAPFAIGVGLAAIVVCIRAESPTAPTRPIPLRPSWPPWGASCLAIGCATASSHDRGDMTGARTAAGTYFVEPHRSDRMV